MGKVTPETVRDLRALLFDGRNAECAHAMFAHAGALLSAAERLREAEALLQECEALLADRTGDIELTRRSLLYRIRAWVKP